VGDNGALEVPAEGKDELECDSVASALDAVSSGRPVAILDAADREGETDLFVPAITMAAADLRLQRTAAGGELYIAVGHEIASAFGFPFAGDALAAASSTFPVLSGMAKYNGDMCQGSCSVGLSLDHRSTHTGAPDNERSLTCRRLAEMARDALEVSPDDVERNGAAFGGEFHVPGHVFMCTEAREGLAARQVPVTTEQALTLLDRRG
jgi:3,4-dihydroxy 2-butanone 4-phosphate synthase